MDYYVAFWGSEGRYPMYGARVSAESEDDAKVAAKRGFKLATVSGAWETMECAIRRIEVREITPTQP